jgi:asparagine synthase (glutamine-hydrolysing)
MMVSLEVRSPFLDNNMVDFARLLPSKYKIKNGVTKYILKKSMSGILPKEILWRSKKGFAMPLTKWLKESNINSAIGDGLNNEFIERCINRHKLGIADNRLFIWSLLVLQKFISKSKKLYL